MFIELITNLISQKIFEKHSFGKAKKEARQKRSFVELAKILAFETETMCYLRNPLSGKGELEAWFYLPNGPVRIYANEQGTYSIMLVRAMRMDNGLETEVEALCNELNAQNDGFTFVTDPPNSAGERYVHIAREITEDSSLPDAHLFIPQYIDEELLPRQCSLVKTWRERLQANKNNRTAGSTGSEK